MSRSQRVARGPSRESRVGEWRVASGDSDSEWRVVSDAGERLGEDSDLGCRRATSRECQ
jgi:hypothetical protein